MDTGRFKEIVMSFLDSNDHFHIEKGGEMLLQFGSDVINAQLGQHHGSLYVRENGKESRAEDWVMQRVAMLPLLADRIISSISENPTFVTPRGSFLDELNRAPKEESVEVTNAVSTVAEFLARRPGGTCSVLYLTSDAGEGKTTLINQLAREQALRFRKRQSDWLLVPIGLGGRPFLRFDDVVVAALMNQLRFQRLYFDGFLQLVRMGVLVPALDGFEEIFVETSEGDAVSSLGTLISQLRGEGTLLIAARKAYFEFRNLQTQARLMDALPNVEVSFGRMSLHRWTREEFLRFASLSGVDHADRLYSKVIAMVGDAHPLVTRPVLVRRLVELAEGNADPDVESLRPFAKNFFRWLVDKLIEREAQEKWIDKYGDPPKPLLSVREHHELLSFVAEEMWISRTSSLNDQMLDSLAELFCEAKGHSPVVSRQVKERLKQHALIISLGQFKKEFAFDHDDFREFFLGEELADHLRGGSEPDVRKLFRVDVLPRLAIDSAVHAVNDGCKDIGPLIALALRVGLSESSSTFVRENAGAIITPLLECTRSTRLEISGLVLPTEGLRARSIAQVIFKNCYFKSTSLDHASISKCSFVDCEFEHLGLQPDTTKIDECILSRSTRIHSLTVVRGEEVTDYYDPNQIAAWLVRAGFGFESQVELIPSAKNVDLNPDLKIIEKALQTFHRTTVVHQGTFRLRLSGNANHFLTHLAPRLLRVGVLEFASGPAGDERYRLGMSLRLIAEALSHSDGSLDGFLDIAAKLKAAS